MENNLSTAIHELEKTLDGILQQAAGIRRIINELKTKQTDCNHRFVAHYCTECGMCDAEDEFSWTEP